MKKIEYRCPECGSREVLQDAFVHMNDEYDVRTFDNKTCDSCGASFDEAAEVMIDTEDPDHEIPL